MPLTKEERKARKKAGKAQLERDAPGCYIGSTSGIRLAFYFGNPDQISVSTSEESKYIQLNAEKICDIIYALACRLRAMAERDSATLTAARDVLSGIDSQYQAMLKPIRTFSCPRCLYEHDTLPEKCFRCGADMLPTSRPIERKN